MAAARNTKAAAKHTLLVPIRGGHSAANVGDALITTFAGLPPGLRRTLTWDQGNEMFQQEHVESGTGLRIYFADPHSPWQRPSNENTNGLIRQYFPKGTNFNNVSDDHMREVANELNDRPRMCLGDRSPRQVMARWHHYLVTMQFATMDGNRRVSSRSSWLRVGRRAEASSP